MSAGDEVIHAIFSKIEAQERLEAQCTNCGHEASAHDAATGRCFFDPQSSWFHWRFTWNLYIAMLSKQ